MNTGRDTTYMQRELDMFFSNKSRFIRDIYDVTSASDNKVVYEVEVGEPFTRFSEDLSPDKVFAHIEQIVDDVREIIKDNKVDYHHWNDLVFHKDETFDTKYFEKPVPDIIYKCTQKVGSLGVVLLCLHKDQGLWYLTLRDTKGRIFTKDTADINEMNNASVAYRSLSLAALPQEYFDEDTAIHEKVDDAVDDLNEKHYANADAITQLGNEFKIGGSVYTLNNKMNEVYPRTVGDDSLLSQGYRKMLKNQVDIYDLQNELHGYTDGEQVEHPGFIPETNDRLEILEDDMADAQMDIQRHGEHIADIEAFPELNMTGIPPFYLLRRGDFSSVSNRAYDPVFFSDFPADTSSVLWLHPAEERVKQMVPRILKDATIKASVDRLVREANENGTTGNKIEIGSYVGVYYFFAADPATWTPAASYTRKETMTMISIVPARWGGNAFRPALLFEVVSGHLDGGSAAGDFTGQYCLLDRSTTDTPDYHWYRYGDNVNINGMALSTVKIQYH